MVFQPQDTSALKIKLNKIKKKFETTYSEWRSDIVFETPNYKVWVGDFRNRLEAERAFVKLKKDFKSAIIFKP